MQDQEHSFHNNYCVLFLGYHSSRKVCIGSQPRVCKGKLSQYPIILLTFSSVGWFVFVHCRTSFMSTCLRRHWSKTQKSCWRTSQSFSWWVPLCSFPSFKRTLSTSPVFITYLWYGKLKSPFVFRLNCPSLCFVAVQVHSSSGHKYALKEVLSDPAVTTRLADTKVIDSEC